jgi:chromosome segregation ATPase
VTEIQHGPLNQERQEADPARTDVAALQAELFAAHAKLQRLQAEVDEQRSRADRAEGESATLRKALARDARLLEQAEVERKKAETQRDGAQAARNAAQAYLASWTAGGPLARAWRGFWRGR